MEEGGQQQLWTMNKNAQQPMAESQDFSPDVT